MNRTLTIRSGEDLVTAVGELRRCSGMTQAELAEQAGLTREYIAKIEAGRSVTLLEHTLRLLRRLGATVTVTFDDTAPTARNDDGC